MDCSMDGCGFPFCAKKRIEEPCPRHAPKLLTHFCAAHSCLEMLCEECFKAHQQAHLEARSEPRICPLADVEHYFARVTAKELDYEKKRNASQAQKRLDPCEVLCEFVDEYFYGSTENKLENLKVRQESLEKPNTKAFIDIIERSSHYRLEADFKQRYFALLDSILAEAAAQ